MQCCLLSDRGTLVCSFVRLFSPPYIVAVALYCLFLIFIWVSVFFMGDYAQISGNSWFFLLLINCGKLKTDQKYWASGQGLPTLNFTLKWFGWAFLGGPLKLVFSHFLLVLVKFPKKNFLISCLVDESLAEKQVRKEVWRVNIWANSVPPPAPLPLQEEALHSTMPGILQSGTIYFTLYRDKNLQLSVRMGEGQSPGAMKKEKAASNPTAPRVTFSSLFEVSPLPES